MSLDYAILGFLNYHQASGYDLKKIFDSTVRHFWPADQGQIYRTLGRLAENGWVEMEEIPQEDRPNRKVYQITETGKTELRRWLVGPPPLGEPRSAPLIQVFFSGQLSDSEILDKFMGYATLMRSFLSQYQSVSNQFESIHEYMPSPREHFFWQLTLENGIVNMQANLAWAESVIERIKAGRAPSE